MLAHCNLHAIPQVVWPIRETVVEEQHPNRLRCQTDAQTGRGATSRLVASFSPKIRCIVSIGIFTKLSHTPCDGIFFAISTREVTWADSGETICRRASAIPSR